MKMDKVLIKIGKREFKVPKDKLKHYLDDKSRGDVLRLVKECGLDDDMERGETDYI